MKLKGNTAIITGASGRLGAEFARALAEAGCNCICHYYKNRESVQKLIEEIKESNVKAVAVEADLTVREQINDLFDKAAEFGTVRILINSAAVFSRQPLAKVTFEEAQRVLNLNQVAPIVISGVFAQRLKAELGESDSVIGKILNISDVGGIQGWAEYSVYCSSKAGLIGATKAMAKELAPNICVNSIAPGMVTWPKDFDESQKKRQLSMIPLKRQATPVEITAAGIFLLENDYITGQVLNVDGGRCM